MYIPSEIVDILSQLNCEEVAKKLGIQVIRHRCRCFMHDDQNPSLSFFSKNYRAWNCFVCHKGGNAIHLVMNRCGIDFVQSCHWLAKEFNIQLESQRHTDWNSWYRKSIDQVSKFHPKPIPPLHYDYATQTTDKKPFNKEVASYLLSISTLTSEAEKFLYDERRLSPEVIQQLGIVGITDSRKVLMALSGRFTREEMVGSGFVKENKGKFYLRLWTPCILFPYRSHKGELTGIQSRYLGSDENAPRFQFVSGFKASIFNLPITNALRRKDKLYLAEGITDCLALLSSGKNAVAVPSASILPDMDLWRLRHFDLHMYPDNDGAGHKAYDSILSRMIDYSSYVWKETLPSEYKDYSEYYKSTTSHV